MKAFAFDRDDTVSTSRGPVPIDLVRELSRKHVVYAIGNQKLREEADIPGDEDLSGSFPIKNIFQRLTMSKPEKLERIKEKHPGCEKYIVVDDVDLRTPEGWNYFSPQEFVSKWPDI